MTRQRKSYLAKGVPGAYKGNHGEGQRICEVPGCDHILAPTWQYNVCNPCKIDIEMLSAETYEKMTGKKPIAIRKVCKLEEKKVRGTKKETKKKGFRSKKEGIAWMNEQLAKEIKKREADNPPPNERSLKEVPPPKEQTGCGCSGPSQKAREAVEKLDKPIGLENCEDCFHATVCEHYRGIGFASIAKFCKHGVRRVS